MARLWEDGRVACEIEMFMSSASIGAKTALRVFIIQTGTVSNSHCFVVESPRSFSTSSGVTSSKAGRLCMFCELSKFLESLVDSRMSSVFLSKNSERSFGEIPGSSSDGGDRIEFNDFQSNLPSPCASSILRRRWVDRLCWKSCLCFLTWESHWFFFGSTACFGIKLFLWFWINFRRKPHSSRRVSRLVAAHSASNHGQAFLFRIVIFRFGACTLRRFSIVVSNKSKICNAMVSSQTQHSTNDGVLRSNSACSMPMSDDRRLTVWVLQIVWSMTLLIFSINAQSASLRSGSSRENIAAAGATNAKCNTANATNKV